jgi:hypothetical protein
MVMGIHEELSRERTQLVFDAINSGAKTALEIFNHIIKGHKEPKIKRLWGSYHQLSHYLDTWTGEF